MVNPGSRVATKGREHLPVDLRGPDPQAREVLDRRTIDGMALDIQEIVDDVAQVIEPGIALDFREAASNSSAARNP